jgi:hypothetical protein
LAVVELPCVLAEVPDVSTGVLGERIERVLHEVTLLENLVVDDGRRHAENRLRLVCDVRTSVAEVASSFPLYVQVVPAVSGR